MNADRFLDTNILVYAYDIDEPGKRIIALQFVEEGWNHYGGTAFSVQVLQELYVNLLRKGQSLSTARKVIRDFAEWPIIENTYQLLESALDIQMKWKTSLWDALILGAAHASGAKELITENLNHGQDYGGLRVVNPFLR